MAASNDDSMLDTEVSHSSTIRDLPAAAAALVWINLDPVGRWALFATSHSVWTMFRLHVDRVTMYLPADTEKTAGCSHVPMHVLHSLLYLPSVAHAREMAGISASSCQQPLTSSHAQQHTASPAAIPRLSLALVRRAFSMLDVRTSSCMSGEPPNGAYPTAPRALERALRMLVTTPLQGTNLAPKAKGRGLTNSDKRHCHLSSRHVASTCDGPWDEQHPQQQPEGQTTQPSALHTLSSPAPTLLRLTIKASALSP
jgi:hypothetical protein